MPCWTCAFSPTSSTICPSLDAKSLDAEALAGRLRASIAGYMNCWASTDKAAFKPVPVEVSLLIKEPQAAPLMAAAALNWQQAAARWQEYRTELAINPDAKPPAALG